MLCMERLSGALSAHNRRRKWALFLQVVRPTQTTRVLDVGYADREYADTDNFMEKHYPYLHNVTALGVEDPSSFRERYPAVHVVQYDGERFPFEDDSFDVCWSNAVLEHVGDWEAQRRFLQEVYRVARVALVTTPNRFFPVEVHTRLPLLHFLPKRVFDRVLAGLGKAWAAGDYMHLRSCRQIRSLLREAGITKYRIVKNRLLLFTLDFVVILNR